MMLVTLMSVTGAWAETFTQTFTAKYAGLTTVQSTDEERFSFVKYNIINSNKYVSITINSGSLRGTEKHSDPDSSPDGDPYIYFYIDWIYDAVITVSSQDPENVTLVSVTIDSEKNDVSGSTWTSSNIRFGQITVEYNIEHTHVSNHWSTNGSQHWHVCEGTGALCPIDDKILDRANHVYNVDLTNDASTYTCSVCGYVDNTKKTEYQNRDYLSMKAVGGNVTIGMTKSGSPANYDLLYSFDKLNWTPVALTATNSNIVDIASGRTCYFRHGTETAIDGINTDGNYWTFTMTGSGTIEAGGNTMSLLDITTKKTNIGSHAFANLFKGCGKLTKAPKLLATSTSTRCYKGMFEETGITEAPALPAARVVKGAYENMFMNCQNLEKAPTLLATRVDWTGYQNMFNGCKKITEITLGNIETIENGNAFSHWLDGTAYETEGTLITPDAMVANTSVSLPRNWMFKQIRDYTTAVSNALDGTTGTIKSIGEEYIQQIKQATSNASALSLRDEALNGINLLKKYNSQIEAGQFYQPTGAGMRLKVKTKNGKVYEFSTKDIESTEYYRATE